MRNKVTTRRLIAGKRLKICLISSGSCDAVGGLASYMRSLAYHGTSEYDVSGVARIHLDGPPGIDYDYSEKPRTLRTGSYETHIITPKGAFRPLLRHLHHFTSRAKLMKLAPLIFRQAYQAALSAAVPADTDVIHFVGTGWDLLGFAALAEARRRDVAFTVLPAVHPGTWGDSALDVLLYNQADIVFTLSQFERQHLIECGAQCSRLEVIGLAPSVKGTGNASRFRARHNLGDRPLILFIGRKHMSKGYHQLCSAMPKVLEKFPDSCLVIVAPSGDPTYPPLPESASLDLGKADEAEKEDALAACDVFCMPSATESFGIVYVEAWSYAKAVVGGPAPAVRELITDDVNGFCVEQKQEAIAEILIRLLSDRVLRTELGSAGQRLQQDRFTWEIVVRAHKDKFNQLLFSEV